MNELITFFKDTPDPFPRDVQDGDGVVLERGVARLFQNFDLLGSPIGASSTVIGRRKCDKRSVTK